LRHVCLFLAIQACNPTDHEPVPPYPVRSRGIDREASMKKVVLSVFPNKFVWFVGVDVEFVLSCRFDPLGRYGDESEEETLDSVCVLDSKEKCHERQSHDVSVEVCRHCGNEKENGVLVHERLWQMCPSEIVVLAVEDLLCSSSPVVVLYNLAVLIACQRTAKPQVGVNYRGQNTVKFVQNEKYSAQSGDFL